MSIDSRSVVDFCLFIRPTNRQGTYVLLGARTHTYAWQENDISRTALEGIAGTGLTVFVFDGRARVNLLE